jgi:hypothetical protein
MGIIHQGMHNCDYGGRDLCDIDGISKELILWIRILLHSLTSLARLFVDPLPSRQFSLDRGL